MANPALPVPRTPIATRLAEMRDLPFLDDLQKKHSKQLGFFPRAQMEGYIQGGYVLIADLRLPIADLSSSIASVGPAQPDNPVGYCISRDRYLKRDELGVIYQLCVAPGHQRGLIGATLVKEVFARSAYGCRLYCCWCAQDLEANYFWESLGFVPIAFRAGSTGKRRIHIFWQRRVDRAAGSITTHQSPYWYPFKTDGGAIRADRIVFPIPPGVRWQDVVARASSPCELEKKEKDTGGMPVSRKAKGGTPMLRKKPTRTQDLAGKVAIIVGGRIKYVDRPGAAKPAEPTTALLVAKKRIKTPKEKAPIDPTYLAKARELRDRWMERANEQRLIGTDGGKYDVSRPVQSQIASVEPAQPDNRQSEIPALPAA